MEMRKSKPLTTSSVTEILDHAFRIYRNGFLSFIGLVAVVTVPMTLIEFFVSQSFSQSYMTTFTQGYSDTYQSALLSYFLMIIVISIIGGVLEVVLVNGLITYISAENHLGRNPTIMEAFDAARGRLLPLTGGITLFYFLMILIFFVSGIATMCLVGILGFGLAVYMGTCIYAFLTPVIILENIGVGRAISRAWALAKQRFWPLFGLTIVIFIISIVVSLAFTVTQQLLFPQQGFTDFESVQASQSILTTFLQMIINILVTPILPIGYTLMYLDTRVRVEGLDIALQSLDKPDARPSDVPSPSLSGGFVGKDYLNIVILTVGMFVIYFLFMGGSMLFLNQFMGYPGM